MKDSLARGFRIAGFAAANMWLAFHVFAIFISPAGMPPVSPLLADVSQVALPYNQAMFLNHGYHFFAPDPGPSTLISYEVERPDDVNIRGRFPITETSPRLLYHRYFMLAENFRAFPSDSQDRFLEAYARHFSRLHSSNQIALSIVSHNPSSISRIQAGGKLSDDETYDEERIAVYKFDSDTAERATIQKVSQDF